MTEVFAPLSLKLANVDGYRHRQQVVGLFMGLRADKFTSSEWREVCRANGALNSPNFTRNIKSDKDLFTGSAKTGWSLTEKGRKLAAEMFPSLAQEAQAAPETDLGAEAAAALDGAQIAPEPVLECAQCGDEPAGIDPLDHRPYCQPCLERVAADSVDSTEVVEAEPEPIQALSTAALVQSYSGKIKPAFEPPTHENRAPSLLGALARQLRKSGDL